MQQFSFIAEIFVVGGIVSALVIATDLRACRQQMRIMNSVWVLTGLWASVFGLWAYFTFGRERRCRQEDAAARATTETGKQKNMTGMETAGAYGKAQNLETQAAEAATQQTEDMLRVKIPGTHALQPDRHMHALQTGESPSDTAQPMKMEEVSAMQAESMHAMQMEGMQMSGAHAMQMGPERPRWQSVVLSTLHCGAGCTLADLIGEWFLFFVPVAIGGSLIAGSWVLDYLLALVFGIGFQYAAIRGMEPRTPRGEIVRRAAKADILSLTAWQAGMYGWMAVAIFVLRDGTPMPRTSFGFWFMMQIAMGCGFLLALPVNVLLIRYGVKKGM